MTLLEFLAASFVLSTIGFGIRNSYLLGKIHNCMKDHGRRIKDIEDKCEKRHGLVPSGHAVASN